MAAVTSKGKTVILASAREALLKMEEPLCQQGYAVQICSDGAKALELSLRSFCALMVVDCDVPLLAAEKLAQILRANPRTEGMAFFFVGQEGEEIAGFRRHKDQFILRPFNREQLLTAIASFFGRRERTEQVSRQDREVTGSLDQISLVDLLQVFGLNRKDGVLQLTRGEERASVYLVEGCVVNARVGRVSGEKAFFRLLSWENGKFWFAPGVPEIETQIASPLDHLLMEGLRQLDELAAQRSSLPSAETLLTLKVPRDRLPRGLRPTTQEILLLMEYYQQVGDLLEHCPRPDFEILQLLKVLLDKGLVEEVQQVPAVEHLPLLTSEEVIAVKDFFGEGDALLETASAKLILLACDQGAVRAFAQTLQGVPEFEPESDFLLSGDTLGLGDIGRLLVGETLSLRLFCLPAATATSPLWTPFRRRLFGVAALGDDPGLQEAIAFFEGTAHVPVVRIDCNGTSPNHGHLLRRNDRKALRRFLADLASRFTGEPPPAEVI